MAGDDDFLPSLGRVGHDRSFASEIRRAINLAGGTRRAAGGKRRFTGARLSRGSGVGAVLHMREQTGFARGRRVVVKSRIVKLAGKGAAGAGAHLRYLQRDGTTRAGDRGSLYGPGDEVVDGKAFLERGSGDRHQFRFIVSPEDGAEYDDLRGLTRRLMKQMADDLGTDLDWVAVDHFNTGHPHTHIIVRGKGADGRDLIIAPDYLTSGIRQRAADLVDMDLGPRTDEEIARMAACEIEQERFTSIDRRLIAAIDADGIVTPAHANSIEQTARAGRLQTLGRMGLAVEEKRGRWRLDAELEMTLKAMGRQGDIINTMVHEMARHDRSRNSADYAIYDPQGTAREPLVGRVLTTGLSDEHADRRYLIVEGTDGLAHHVDAGMLEQMPRHGVIVRVEAATSGVRNADVTIADVAAENGGRYSVEAHRRVDPAASERFAETHVRRLEALRRRSGIAERTPGGEWIIAPDHLDRVEAHERKAAEQVPVRVETLTERDLGTLPAYEGATWLDKELTSGEPTKLGGQFGAALRRARDLRRQLLITRGFAEIDAGGTRYQLGMMTALERRDMARVGAQLSRELGLGFVEAREGERIEGTLRRQVKVGDASFALVERSHEFTLVPWRPMLERQLGKQVEGMMRTTGDISWTVGRSRGLGIE
jgi:type IV secretory pathway VirD2 relaxase